MIRALFRTASQTAFLMLLASVCGWSQGNSVRTDREVQVVDLGRSGFAPKEIRRPPGKHYLMVRNRTGLDNIDLRLERDKGEKLKQVPLNKHNRNSLDLIELTPGTYNLTEANHPSWILRITVGNK